MDRVPLRLLTCLVLILGVVSCGQPPDPDSRSPKSEFTWSAYGGTGKSNRYAPYDQIDRSNFHKLEIQWTWTSPDVEILEDSPALHTWKFESTPVFHDGVLYTSTSMSQVAAVDARTGETLWTHNPGTYKRGTPPGIGFGHRGVAIGDAGNELRVFIGTGDAFLLALNARTGDPVSSFGDGGRIDLTQGLRRSVSRREYGVNSPPVVCGNTVVVASTIFDIPAIKPMPPGAVRGFDVRTGELKWKFRSIPQQGQFGVDTWKDRSWKRHGGANIWTTMSCDEEREHVYLPFGAPSNDFYGGDRPGNNLFSNSIVALDTSTGERIWHFQTTHHGLWDYDLPAAPNLVDLRIQGETVPALAQVSKQGFTYVLNRETGEPIWPIPERSVPSSEVPGETTSPTQPMPTKPPPFEQQGVSRENLIDLTPELNRKAREILSQYRAGPLYAPPSLEGQFTQPGVRGGASWAGAAFDPTTDTLFVPSITRPSVIGLKPTEGPYRYRGIYGSAANPKGAHPAMSGTLGPEGLPLLEPPWGRVVAIDLNTGDTRWMVPSGRGPLDHPALEERDRSEPLGWPRRSFVLATDSLLYVLQEGPKEPWKPSPRNNAQYLKTSNHNPEIRAYDPETGEKIGAVPLPGNVSGQPITYRVDGRQFLCVPIGGASFPGQFVALSLPDRTR